MAKHDEAPVAGAVFVQFGRKGVFKYGASDRRVQHLRANDLVMWTAIRELARNGADSLHFGRTSVSNEGLRRFKLGWRPEEYKIQYLTYDFRQSAFVRSRDRAYGWHNRLFGAMPVWVARIAGSLLYRRFA
jgi:lipid II:glycine glycyltransferase (peptidoglycan interpeptide bridge formation enzyme)